MMQLTSFEPSTAPNAFKLKSEFNERPSADNDPACKKSRRRSPSQNSTARSASRRSMVLALQRGISATMVALLTRPRQSTGKRVLNRIRLDFPNYSPFQFGLQAREARKSRRAARSAESYSPASRSPRSERPRSAEYNCFYWRVRRQAVLCNCIRVAQLPPQIWMPAAAS